MDGQVTGKGFSSYQVNDALLANVVEAIKKGEADARRYSQLRSFEVYYEGYRERLVLGRILIVPAKLADTPEDFPSALLYGAMMKEISPEQQADLYAFKLGESEFDQYDGKSLKAIKEKLFTDAEGVLRSIIIFIPTWANVRDYIIFKMTRDWDALQRMVRHQIFAAYYDPRFSSAFDRLSEDTEHLNVSDITPKLNYPGLAEGQLQSFPELEPGDGQSKTASASKPRVLLAADNVDEISEKFLEPGEKAVIDNLADELKARVSGEIEEPEAVAKQGGMLANEHRENLVRDYVESHGGTIPQALYIDDTTGVVAEQRPDHDHYYRVPAQLIEEMVGQGANGKTARPTTQDFLKQRTLMHSRGWGKYYQCSDCKAPFSSREALASHAEVCPGTTIDPSTSASSDASHLQGVCADCENGYCAAHGTKRASTDDQGATTGLRSQPDYGESDSYTATANAMAAKGASMRTAGAIEWGMYKDEDGFHWSVFEKGLGKPKLVKSGVAATAEEAQTQIDQHLQGKSSLPPQPFNNRLEMTAGKTAADRIQTYPAWKRAIKKLFPDAYFEGDVDIAQAFIKQNGEPLGVGEWEGSYGEVYKDRASKQADQFPNYYGERTPRQPYQPDADRLSQWEAKYGNMPAQALRQAEITLKTHLQQNQGKAIHPEMKWRVEETQAELNFVREQMEKGKPSINKDGHTLTVNKGRFIATAKTGHVETLRINGKKIKWVRPLQFTAAFRAAAETFIKNPTNHKKADVPQTFEDIWSEIAEPMGPAPVVELKNVPKSDGSASTETGGKSRLEKMHERRGEDADGKPNKVEESKPVIEAESDKTEDSQKPWEKEAAKVKTASVQTGRQPSIGRCAACKLGVWQSEGSEVAPGLVLHAACQEKAKKAAFDMYMPGQVIKEFYPELMQESVDFPGGSVGGEGGFDPAIGLPGLSPSGVQQSADGIPGNGDPYISTDPAAAMGIGRDGKPQVLEGAPLRQENDIRGYQFDQEYYAQQQGLNPKAFVAAYAVERINKKASTEEFQAQFADFLKKAMGEIAASFIAAFKVTSRPLMNKVPGTGELRLDQVESSNMPLPLGATDLASRVRFLMSKLTDSQIKDAINGAWAQSAVWNEDENGGYTYEVFIRPDSIDKTTMVLKYEFVVGTKGL